jgi:hypothetical protein
MADLTFAGNRSQALAKVRELVGMLSGRVPDKGIAEGLLTRMGMALLGDVQESFVVKSQGGIGADGIKWAPLSPTTLALRRKATSQKIADRLIKQFKSLPIARKILIKKNYQALYRLYRAEGMSDQRSLRARKYALRILELTKKSMAPGRYSKLKAELSKDLPKDRAKRTAWVGAFALILRDTGRLLNSLSPQIASPDRILRVMPGAFSVGSNVSYFRYHQSDKPRRLKRDGSPKLPRRQILPDQGKPIPAPWWADIKESLAQGLADPGLWQRHFANGTAAVR